MQLLSVQLILVRIVSVQLISMLVISVQLSSGSILSVCSHPELLVYSVYTIQQTLYTSHCVLYGNLLNSVVLDIVCAISVYLWLLLVLRLVIYGKLSSFKLINKCRIICRFCSYIELGAGIFVQSI